MIRLSACSTRRPMARRSTTTTTATSHVPLAVKTWGVERFEIDRGIDGPYEAAVHLFFDSVEAMGAAMAAEGTAAVRDDVANYTTITPERQLSEVVDS